MHRSRLASVLFILLILNSTISLCQVWQVVYEPVHSMGREVVPANDEGFVTTGINSEFDDGITFKINPVGEIVWAAPHGGFAMTRTSDGYLLAGYNDYNHAAFKKLDEEGNLLWTRPFWGINSLDINALITTSDSCFVACGRANTDPHRNIFIMKTDLDGDTLWTMSLFSFEFGVASDLVEFGGYYYITGRFDDPESIYYQTLIKLSTDGDLIWQKTYPFGWGGYSIAMTNDSCLIVAGRELLVKFNLDGDTIWKRNFTAGSLYSVDVLSDNGFIVSGWRSIGGYACKNLVARIDPDGNTLWWKLYPNGFNQMVASFASIIATPDDGFVACGYSDYDTAYLHRVIKADAEGNIIVGTPDKPDENLIPAIYPNPFTQICTIGYENIWRVEVYNAIGGLVGVFLKNEIDLGGQPSGIYFVRIDTAKGFVIRKVIKR